MKSLLFIFLAVQTLIGGRAQFDKTVHDFGTISVKDGAQSCVFTVTNVGDKPLTILSAVPSCGCTGVEWTRSTLASGEEGTISVVYKNEDGPYPFDKSVTVYLSDIKKPVILHLRGVVTKK